MKTLPLVIVVTFVAFVVTLVEGQNNGNEVVTSDPAGEDSTTTTPASPTDELTPDPFFGYGYGYGYGCPNCGGYGPRGWGRHGMGWGMRGGRWGMRGGGGGGWGPGWGRGRHWGGRRPYGMMGYRRGYGPPWADFDDRKDNSNNDDNVPCFCPYPPPGYGPRGYNGVDGYRNTEHRRVYLNHPCCNPQNEVETTIQ